MKVILAGGLALVLFGAFPGLAAANDWRTQGSWGFHAAPGGGWSHTDRYGTRPYSYGHPYPYGHRYGSWWGFGHRSPGFSSKFRFGGHGYGSHGLRLHRDGFGRRGYGYDRHVPGFGFGSRGRHCDR